MDPVRKPLTPALAGRPRLKLGLIVAACVACLSVAMSSVLPGIWPLPPSGPMGRTMAGGIGSYRARSWSPAMSLRMFSATSCACRPARPAILASKYGARS